jgi:Protein of unknown function (DUF1566)
MASASRGFARSALVLGGVGAVALASIGCNAVLGLDESTLVLDGSIAASDGAGSNENDGGNAMPVLDATLDPGPVTDGSVTGHPGPFADASIAVSPDGSLAPCASPCSTGLACERYEGPACLDPLFAQWPVPNAPADTDGGAPNREKYTNNGDGTVTDDVTGLMWQQAGPTGKYTQPDALKYCVDLTLAGYRDWRLPSEIELVSLVDYDQSNPSIDPKYFPGELPYSFWSSTPSVNTPTFGWGVTFAFGSTGTNALVSPNSVRCAR